MTIKILRLKSGEDVISNVKEVYDNNDRLISYLLVDPYTVSHYLDEDDYEFENEPETVDNKLKENKDGDLVLDISSSDTGLPDKPFKIERVRLQFYPWCPMSTEKSIFLTFDWVVTAYEPFPEIKEKYLNLLKEMGENNDD
jgi:hypothetical protein